MSLRNFFRYRYYRKLVCSFVLIGVLLISISVSCISILFSQLTGRRMGEMSVASVRETASSLDTLLSNCENAANMLMNEKYFYSVTTGYKVDRLKEYSIVKNIEKIQVSYPYIRYMGVINKDLDRYVGTRGVYWGCGEEVEMARAARGEKPYAVFTRTVRRYENTPEAPKVTVLTFFYEPFVSQRAGSCIVIDLDLDYLNSQLAMLDSDLWEGVTLLDEAGIPVLGSQADSWVRSVQGGSLLEAFAEGGDFNWFYSSEGGDGKKLVSYCKLAKLPWTVVGVQSWKQMASVFEGTQWVFFAVALLVIAIYVILSVFFSNYIYSPIKSIRDYMGIRVQKESLDELETMRNIFHRYIQQEDHYRWNSSKDREALRKRLSGREEPEQWAETADPVLAAVKAGAFYCAILLSADSASRQNEVYTDRQLYLFVLKKMAEELLGEAGFRCFSLSVPKRGDDFLILCETGKPEIPPKMEMGLEELQLGLQREFHISVSIGVSLVRQGEEALQAAFAGAQKALKQRVLKGPFLLMFEKSLKEPASSEEYPILEERKILEGIFSGNLEKAEKGCRAFFECLRRCRADQVFGYFHRLYFSTLVQERVCRDLPPALRESLWAEALDLQYLEEMEKAYAALCRTLVEQLSKTVARSSTETIVYEVKSYIDLHYADPSISLGTLADTAGISAAYLGQIFAKKLGLPCAEYLNQVRMEKAAEMLLKTNLTVQQISGKVGILNTNYFYTLFKKVYGSTPSKYRVKRQGVGEKPDSG